jgi:hypothetical protein
VARTNKTAGNAFRIVTPPLREVISPRIAARTAVAVVPWGTFPTCPARWNRAPLIVFAIPNGFRLPDDAIDRQLIEHLPYAN